jgi:peptide/nickel transport system ATP-binding protein
MANISFSGDAMSLKDNKVLVEINGLKIQFGKTSVVDNVSFTINNGEIVGIVGESGSGKSLTALSVMRLTPPDAKIITTNGILFYNNSKPTDISQIHQKEIRRLRGNQISMIFQEPMTSLNAVQKCGPQVSEVLHIHRKLKRKDIRKKVLNLFEEVLLPEPEKIYERYPHQLSGGQRQRVMIAMALACNPKLLIADEPTTALDVTVQKAVLQLLRDLQQKYKMSIVFITHDLGVVMEICQRVLVMNKGQIVEELTIEQLVSGNVEHQYTKGLLACRPPADSKPKRLQTISDFLENKPQVNNVQSETINTEENKNAIIQVRSLNKHFPAGKNLMGKPVAWYKAVDDVSFHIFEGETLGLVGESGCGKTTLSRTILKLIEPTSGNILFNNDDIAFKDRSELKTFRKQAQIIFQDPYSSLNPNMTIGTALNEPLKVHGLMKNRNERESYVVETLEKVGLCSDDLRKYPHQFSGGQRQRIVIARAIVLKPRFIICDEAVSALDVSVQAQVLNLLNDLKEELGLTYLFISHDLSVVKYMSQRIMVMQKGKIVETGPSDEVFFHPGNDYTKKLIESVPGLRNFI